MEAQNWRWLVDLNYFLLIVVINVDETLKKYYKRVKKKKQKGVEKLTLVLVLLVMELLAADIGKQL